MKILFVCRANVARSQMAEGFLKHIMPLHDVSSAGTTVTGHADKPGEPHLLKDAPEADHIIKVMKEIGIDISKAERQQLTEGMLDDKDRIIVLSEPESAPSYLKEFPGALFWEVSALGDGLDYFRNLRDSVKKKIEDNIELFK